MSRLLQTRERTRTMRRSLFSGMARLTASVRSTIWLVVVRRRTYREVARTL